MLDVYWLLCVCIRTIEHADNTGSLFAFTPEFYLNVAMNAYSALKNYFSPANSMEELPGNTQQQCDSKQQKSTKKSTITCKQKTPI